MEMSHKEVTCDPGDDSVVSRIYLEWAHRGPRAVLEIPHGQPLSGNVDLPYANYGSEPSGDK
jgi:hypothetical protein